MTARGLVIFDCDGVLVDSEPISMRELTRAIRAEGGTLDEREVWDAFMGVSLRAIEEGVAAHLGRPLAPGWIEAFVTTRADAFERELRAVPGAREAIDGVRALGCEVCVASQGRPSKLRQTLRITGLDTGVPNERIFSATMVPHGKPAPDLFLHAARSCGFAPARCVVVEDSVTGVTAARTAGMRVLGYVAGAPAGEAPVASPDGAGAALVDAAAVASPEDAGAALVDAAAVASPDRTLAGHLAALGAEVFHDMREVPARVVG